MCCDIYKSSAESYNILKKYIQFFPLKIEIEKFLNENTPNIPENITNVQKIPKIIVEYKKENKILSKQNFCCKAVDALFFKPDVQIDSNGIVSGMNKEYELGKKAFSLFSRDVKSFTNFIQKNWRSIIKSGFVIQLNPFLKIYKPIVLLIIPKPRGKADSEIVNILFEIKNVLHRYRVEVVSFSFDGD